MIPERHVRPALPTDIARAAALAERAFRRRPVGSDWASYLGETPYLGADDVLLAFEGDAPVGLLVGLGLRASLAGADVPVRGVGAVAVAPERRRTGVAGALVRAALCAGYERGEPVSLLFAFRQPFYRALGYGLVEAREQLRAAPDRLLDSPLRAHVVRFEPGKHGRAVRSLYERSRAGTTGQLCRDDYWWRRRVFARPLDGAVFVPPGAEEPTGYALYEVDDGRPAPHCHVHELRADGGEALRGLVGFFASLGDQYALVSMAVARGESIALVHDHGLADAPAEWAPYDPIALARAGAMGRIVHLARAFEAHPGARRDAPRGAFGLDVDDPVLGAQSGAYDVELGPHGAALGRGAAAAERLAMGIDRLTQVFFGATSAATLLRFGLARGSERAARQLDRVFEGPAPFLGTLNGF